MAKLTGTKSGDLLVGTSGADSLYGEDGSDILKGGGGADYIDGGAGVDLVSYATSGAAVRIDLNNIVQQGGDAAGDQLYNVEAVTGSAYGDTLTGNSYDNTFKGGGGADYIDGGRGSDTVSYDGTAAAVQINLATAVQQGGEAAGDQLTSIENVIGTAYGDTLRGNSALNRLEGRAGDDGLFGGFDGRADVLDGGAGTDTVDYSSAPRAMTIALGEGAGAGSAILNQLSFGSYLDGRSVVSLPAVQEDALHNIENVVGTYFSDHITGNSGDNRLEGGDGNDTFVGRGGNDTIDGGEGSDTIVLEPGASGAFVSVSGSLEGTNHQVLYGRPPFSGDNGTIDLISIENVTGTNGNDSIIGNADVNTLRGGGGQDILYGENNDDRLFGDDGDDYLEGGGGDDHLDGGEGSDTADYGRVTGDGENGVWVDLDAGTAQAFQGSLEFQGRFDTLAHIENVMGSDFNDELRGDAANNTFHGREGDDLLEGNGGNDTLNGGRGDDEMYGGADDDTFFFTVSLGVPELATIGQDTIFDFEPGHDRIAFTQEGVMRASQVGPHTVLTFDGIEGSVTVMNTFVNDIL